MKIEFCEKLKIPSSTAQQRRFGRNGRTWCGESLALAKATWRALAEKHAPAQPMRRPVSVRLIFGYASDGPGGPKATRPDLDNLAKLIQDALTKAKYWRDDAPIWHLDLIKVWLEKGMEETVMVTVEEYEE